jgi:hypothetical protein
VPTSMPEKTSSIRIKGPMTCDDLCYMPVGYLHRVADVLREQRKQKHGLYFAGEYVVGRHFIEADSVRNLTLAL